MEDLWIGAKDAFCSGELGLDAPEHYLQLPWFYLTFLEPFFFFFLLSLASDILSFVYLVSYKYALFLSLDLSDGNLNKEPFEDVFLKDGSFSTSDGTSLTSGKSIRVDWPDTLSKGLLPM